jgi:ATP-dependent Clp protease ATP-binding subunit ClpB
MEAKHFSADSKAVLKVAQEVAASFRHPEIDIEHILITLVRHEGSEVESVLSQLGKSAAFIESTTESYLKEQPKRSSPHGKLTISPGVNEVLTMALDERSKLYDALVEPEHIFIAIFDPKSKLSSYVREQLDISKEDIYRAIADSKSVEEIATVAREGAEATGAAEGPKEVSGTLKYCLDMTNRAEAGEFDPMIGREKELQELIQILLRRRKNSPALVGGAGVGKSAIVEGFAQAVVAEKVPTALQGVKVLEVDMGSMVAGAKYKGEFEERFKTLIGEVVKSGGKLILFIDEIHTLVGAGNISGGMDAANLIKPALARGQLRLIGATTVEEYTKYIEKDKALDRRFERVKIEEPGFDDAVRIVKGVIGKYESHHGITFTDEAVVGSVKYARRYISERNLPDIALDLVDESASEFAVKDEFGKRQVAVIESQIAEIEKLIVSCEGKDSEKDAEEFDKLQTLYDEFSRDLEMLHGFWGHRVEAQAGVEK